MERTWAAPVGEDNAALKRLGSRKTKWSCHSAGIVVLAAASLTATAGCRDADQADRGRNVPAIHAEGEGSASAPEIILPDDPSLRVHCGESVCGQRTIPLAGPTNLTVSGSQVHPVEKMSSGLSGDIEVARLALSTSEATVVATPTIDMAETASAVMVGPGGTSETVVFSNLTNNSGPVTGRWDYGCIRGSTTMCDMDQTFVNVGSDPSLVVGGGYMYGSRLRTPSGWNLGRSSDPCPSGCALAPWSICQVAGVTDWPRLVKADSTTAWAVFNDFINPTNPVSIAKVTWCSSTSTFSIASQCNLGTSSIRDPHAVVGGNGIIHVVFADIGSMTIKYTQFNTNTNQWTCALKMVGPINTPVHSCAGSSGKKVYSKLGNLNLEYTPGAQIARDSVSGALVVVWERYDSGADILGGTAARSTDGGATWNITLGTAVEAGHNAVAYGSSHRFEIGQTYNSTSNQGAQVRWKSTDAGQTWSGIFLSSSRSLAPIAVSTRACYWGDYDAVSWNATNDAFYHDWVDTNQGSNAVIRGLFSTN